MSCHISESACEPVSCHWEFAPQKRQKRQKMSKTSKPERREGGEGGREGGGHDLSSTKNLTPMTPTSQPASPSPTPPASASGGLRDEARRTPGRRSPGRRSPGFRSGPEAPAHRSICPIHSHITPPASAHARARPGSGGGRAPGAIVRARPLEHNRRSRAADARQLRRHRRHHQGRSARVGLPRGSMVGGLVAARRDEARRADARPGGRTRGPAAGAARRRHSPPQHRLRDTAEKATTQNAR